jgi:hypothetical protein
MKRLYTPIILLIAGAIFGVLSAQNMMETENVATNGASGWVEIQAASEGFKAFYTAGHFLRQGEVPPPKGSRFFVRSADDDGNGLRGDCLVNVEGKMPDARWWMLNASSGALRSSLDAGQAVRETNGETNVALSTTPTPGNWIIPPRNGAYELQLVIHGLNDGAGQTLTLPRVKRLWC